MDANFDAIKFIEAKVDLQSYSSTKGFLGYCYSNVGWGTGACTSALMEIIISLIPDTIIVSSLRIYGTLEEYYELYDVCIKHQEVISCLIEHKLIVNSNSDEDDESFHFQGSASTELLRKFVLYQTSIGGISSHGFMTNRKCDFILYPHDDCGLGFIYCGQNNQKAARRQLEIFSERYSNIFDFKLSE